MSSQSKRDVLTAAFATLTPDERQLLVCALAGNHPDQLAPLRMEVLRGLAKADRPTPTTPLILYVARCSRCKGTMDDDGGEYQATPAKAVALAVGEYGEFERRGDQLVCPACCLAEDEPDD